MATVSSQQLGDSFNYLLTEVGIGAVSLEDCVYRLKSIQYLLENRVDLVCLVVFPFRSVEELGDEVRRHEEVVKKDLSQFPVGLNALLLQDTEAGSSILAQLELLPAVDRLLGLSFFQGVPHIAHDPILGVRLGGPLVEWQIVVEECLRQLHKGIFQCFTHDQLLLPLALADGQYHVVANTDRLSHRLHGIHISSLAQLLVEAEHSLDEVEVWLYVLPVYLVDLGQLIEIEDNVEGLLTIQGEPRGDALGQRRVQLQELV